jgi:hypothetical protein
MAITDDARNLMHGYNISCDRAIDAPCCTVRCRKITVVRAAPILVLSRLSLKADEGKAHPVRYRGRSGERRVTAFTLFQVPSVLVGGGARRDQLTQSC